MRKFRVLLYGLGLFSLVLLFQNMSYVTYSTPEPLPTIDEDARVVQAQELLGKKYDGSTAQAVEGEDNLHYRIYSIVHRELPEKWKDSASEITSTIIAESEEQGLDPIFVVAVIQTESHFDPDAVGALGDAGLMQILPETGKWVAEKNEIPWEGKKALFDPVYNIKLGVAYVSRLRSEFSSVPVNYVRAYNMGPTKLKKELSRKTRHNIKGKNKKMYAQIPNKMYIQKVMKNYAKLYKDIATLD